MATPVVSPGNLVVPLSTILDQLKDKLSNAEIDALLAAVLARRKTKVEPGDLITADLINQVLAELGDLQTRVSVLEGQAQPGNKITLKPYLGSPRIGDEITVTGTNFAVPVSLNVVMMGAVRITQFNPGTDGSHLVFNVPNIPGVPVDVTLSVTNSTGSDSIIIRVLAAMQVPVGAMVVSAIPPGIGVIQVGQTYNFLFTLDSQTTIAETYLLSALFSNAVGVPLGAWSENATIRNSNGQTVSSVPVTPGNPATIRVAVTVPAGATRVDLALQVQSVNAPSDPLLNPPPMPITIVVGQSPNVSDSRTTFEQLRIAPTSRLVVDAILGQVVRTPVGQQTAARVTANFTVAGVYNYTARIVPAEPAGAWSATVTSPAPANTSEIIGSSQQIVVQLSADGADSLASRRLEIHATRNGPNGENFDSWFPIPIQNA